MTRIGCRLGGAPTFLARPRAVAAAVVGGAFLLATPLFLGPVVDVVRDAIDGERTRASWPAQRAAIELALDRVDLGAVFALVSCPDDGLGAAQCWQYDGLPADAVPSLAAALTAAAVADVVTECDGAVTTPRAVPRRATLAAPSPRHRPAPFLGVSTTGTTLRPHPER